MHSWGWAWKSVLSTRFYCEHKTAVNIILIFFAVFMFCFVLYFMLLLPALDHGLPVESVPRHLGGRGRALPGLQAHSSDRFHIKVETIKCLNVASEMLDCLGPPARALKSEESLEFIFPLI